MIIGIVYGGKGDEEIYNIKAVIDIENVFANYRINSRRIYLNDEKFTQNLFLGLDVIVVVDSNCRHYRRRRFLIDFAVKNKIDFIGQRQSAFTFARNKFLTSFILRKNDLLVPKSFLIGDPKNQKLSLIIDKKKSVLKNNYPVIIKDNFGSSSENLHLCLSEHGFKVSFGILKNRCNSILVEEYIGGQEITVPIIEILGKTIVLSPIEIIYQGYIYNRKIKKEISNYIKIPPRLSNDIINKIKKVALLTHRIIGCSFYSRIDIKVERNKIFILEINDEPVLSENDFVSIGAKFLDINYSMLIIGLLANSRKFLSYAKAQNKKLFKDITIFKKTNSLFRD